MPKESVSCAGRHSRYDLSCFHLQVFNLLLPSGLQCVAPAGSHHPVLWLAGWQHPFGRVHLGCEEFGHGVPGAGDDFTQPTLHCCIQGNTKSRAKQRKKKKKDLLFPNFQMKWLVSTCFPLECIGVRWKTKPGISNAGKLNWWKCLSSWMSQSLIGLIWGQNVAQTPAFNYC